MKFAAHNLDYLLSHQFGVLVDCGGFQMQIVEGLIVNEIAVVLAHDQAVFNIEIDQLKRQLDIFKVGQGFVVVEDSEFYLVRLLFDHA
jgi:hypothetical protein